MSVRTVTITEEAYRRLRAHKGSDESFSDVVNRLARRRPLSSFAGALTHESSEALRRAIAKYRRERPRLDAEPIDRSPEATRS